MNIGSSATLNFTISNSGNTALTFTALNATGGTGAVGYTATPTSGVIAPGSSISVLMKFSPTLSQFYSNVLKVVGDQTGGNDAINVSGNGINPNPIFSQSGVGDNVFTIPSYVTKIRIDATYGGSCQNFIVHISSTAISLVNVIIGTCSVADTRSPFSGTYAIAGGGTLSITGSTGVAWTVTELR